VSLIPSLLQAIVHVDGDALVMHAGDKPYVVAPTGQVDLATRGLALDAVNGIIGQLLPMDLQGALSEFGAVQHELAPIAEFPGEHFTIVAARSGDDVWVEVRRRRNPDDEHLAEETFTLPDTAAAAQPYPGYTPAPGFSQPAEPMIWLSKGEKACQPTSRPRSPSRGTPTSLLRSALRSWLTARLARAARHGPSAMLRPLSRLRRPVEMAREAGPRRAMRPTHAMSMNRALTSTPSARQGQAAERNRQTGLGEP